MNHLLNRCQGTRAQHFSSSVTRRRSFKDLLFTIANHVDSQNAIHNYGSPNIHHQRQDCHHHQFGSVSTKKTLIGHHNVNQCNVNQLIFLYKSFSMNHSSFVKEFHRSLLKRENAKNHDSQVVVTSSSSATGSISSTSQIVENVKVLETTTTASSQQAAPPATATIVIIQQQQQQQQQHQQPLTSPNVSTHSIADQTTQPLPTTNSAFHHFSSAAIGTTNNVAAQSSTTTSTIIKIDSQVISKEIEKAVTEQIKQKLKHAYEPTREEFEAMESLEHEHLYEEGTRKKIGWIQKFRTFLRKTSTLLSNLLLIGKVLPANAIATLFFSYYKMEKNYKQRYVCKNMLM